MLRTLQFAARSRGSANSCYLSSLDFSSSSSLPQCKSDSDDQVVRSTRNWLVNIVLNLNLCPFSGSVIANTSRLNIRVLSPSCKEADIANEARILISASNVGMTSLLCLPHLKDDFSGFLDLVDSVQEVFDRDGLSDDIQIATFHPLYEFADSSGPDDVTNYTNRSPYPIVHLLLEREVGRALENYKGSPDKIWKNNKLLMLTLGSEQLAKMLEDTKS